MRLSVTITRIIIVSLAAAVLSAGALPAAAEGAGSSEYLFQDLAGHWAAADMEELAFMGLLKGDGAGHIRPNSSITRAEFTCLLARVLELPTEPEQPMPGDVAKGRWYYGEIQSALASGLADGSPDGSFRPEQDISRAEAATLLVRALGEAEQVITADSKGGGTDRPSSYSDVSQEHWAGEYIEQGKSLGLISGNPDGSFKPDAKTTRGEAAAMIYRLLQQLDGGEDGDLVDLVVESEREIARAINENDLTLASAPRYLTGFTLARVMESAGSIKQSLNQQGGGLFLSIEPESGETEWVMGRTAAVTLCYKSRVSSSGGGINTENEMLNQCAYRLIKFKDGWKIYYSEAEVKLID